MRKLLLITALMVVLGLTQAHAVPVTFNVDEVFNWGRLYSYAPGVPGVYTTTNSATYVPGGWTDTAVGTTITENTIGNADHVPGTFSWGEDTWGIGNIDNIKVFPTAEVLWDQAGGTRELTFIFWGFDDDYLSNPDLATGNTTIGSKLGGIKVYQDNSPDFDHGVSGVGGRTGVFAYTGVTDGTLVLDLVPVAMNPSGHTFVHNFNFSSNSGGGGMYLSTTGLGAWDPLYDTNTQVTPIGNIADFHFSYTVRDNSNPSVSDWTVYGDGGGEGNYIPEPASMAIFSIGMLGMGIVRRKRKKA